MATQRKENNLAINQTQHTHARTFALDCSIIGVEPGRALAHTLLAKKEKQAWCTLLALEYIPIALQTSTNKAFLAYK